MIKKSARTKLKSSVKSAQSLLNPKMAKVAIIMGSDSDWKVMKAAAETLKKFKISYHVEVVSAHRTPRAMQTFAIQAHNVGFQAIIAGAGGAAHLPGMVASLTILPVIGIPVALASLRGLDSLLSIAQMPKGVPVATMAIDNATNGALLAARILALHDKALTERLIAFEKKQGSKVQLANRALKRTVRI